MNKIKLLIPVFSMSILSGLCLPLTCCGGGDTPEPTIQPFETCSWKFLNDKCTALEDGSMTQEEFLAAFTIDNEPATDIHQFLGLTKRLQLKHQDLDHDNDPNDYLTGNEVAQTIRVVGTCVDDPESYQVNTIDENGTKAVFTFEFVDVICDANGYSLASLWQDASSTDHLNNDYLNSTLRKNVFSAGASQSAHWYVKEGTQHTNDASYEGKSVFNMLPDDLANGLKSPQNRLINIKTSGQWVETKIDDKLFLPSAIEIEPGYDEQRELGMKGYAFYSDDGDDDANRIKQQIKGHDGALDHDVYITDALFGQTDCSNVAGYDGKSADDPTYGSWYWLSSPVTGVSDEKMCWLVDDSGMTNYFVNIIRIVAPVAPFFCI